MGRDPSMITCVCMLTCHRPVTGVPMARRHPLDKAKRGAVSFRNCLAALKDCEEYASVVRERGEAEEAQAGLQAARQEVMAARRQ